MASVVDSTRFKSMKVGTTMSIRDFATRNGLEFKPGRGFYQLTKPETIQVYKEIVARRKTDSAIVSGAALRKILGIPETSDTKKKFKLDRSTLEDFDIFIQSTSYTRKLMGGTDFLYEVDGAGVSSPFKARQALQGAKDRQAKEAEYRPPLPTGGPGSPIDIVFSFDTTGSMGGCIMEVRKRVEEVIGRLLKDIPNIRIAVLAHGDYCDKANYVTKWVDFTDDLASLSKFVKTVKTTGGGDYPECYELVLYQVRTELSWRDGSQRSLVMIGDAIPHEASEAQNYLSIDWREECGNLASKLGCRVYSVQCHAYGGSNTFWEEMAKLTYGSYLKLDQFSTVIDFIMAICYRERGPEFLQQYEKEVRAREVKSGSLVGGDMNKELHNLFATLKSADGAGPSGAPGGASTSGAAKGGMKRGASILAEISGPGAAKKAKSSPKKAAPKKPAGAAKKPAGAAKKPAGAAKKPAGAAKKPPAKKTPAKKAPAKKAPAKKAPAKKAPAKKAPAKKAPAKKAPAKKAATKKSPAKKAPAKKGKGKK